MIKMADLDDYFAKKDKKKSRGKKFTTVDEVAKKLEDTNIKRDSDIKPKKEKERSENDPNHKQDEDEWKDFEEEKKDYSGLKIQSMQLPDPFESGAQSGDDDSENGEGGEGKGRKVAGPWKMPVNQEEGSDDDDDDSKPEPVTKRPEPKESEAYVLPARRNLSSSMQPKSHSSLRSKIAPDINNEAFFPTLSSAASNEATGVWGKKGRIRDDDRGFEDVRNSKSHSGRYERSLPGSSSGRVAVENKFDALRHSEQS